jgi:hypothetical protein
VTKLSFCLVAAAVVLASATSAYAVVPVASYQVPEPATGALVAAGIGAWFLARRRRR